MAKRGKNRKRGDARLRLVQNNEVQQRVEVEAQVQPLVQEIRTRLRDEDPMALLGFVSTLVAATDGRHGFADPSPVALEDLVDTLIDVDLAETTAVLHVLAQLAPTEAMRALVSSTLGRRRQPMPRWLADLPETTVTAAARIGYQTEPGKNFLIEHRWPGGDLNTYVIFDEGLGRGVKDAFPTPGPMDEITEHMRNAAPGVPFTATELDLATARATIEQGLLDGADRPVDEENDSWPSGRPIVEWLLGLMPTGGIPDPTTFLPLGLPGLPLGLPDLPPGASTVHPDPDDVIVEFAESSEAAAIGFDADDLHDDAAIQAIVDYASMMGIRDPLTWNTEGVRELLEHYLIAVNLPDPTTARRIQGVLEAYLIFCGARTGLSTNETAALLRAAQDAIPSYLEIALSEQAQTLRRALLDYMELTDGAFELDINVIGEDAGLGAGSREPDGWLDLDESLNQFLLQDTARQVGGVAALERLDDAPLPDDDLDLTGVPEDIRSDVEEVSRLVDAFADQHPGVEFRTAARRFLARAAAGDPVIFRRGARTDTAAAAVAWAVARGNDLVGARNAELSVQDLVTHFGVKATPSTRAQVFVKAVDGAWIDPGGPHLGSPDLLVSSMRARLLSTRDRVGARDL